MFKVLKITLEFFYKVDFVDNGCWGALCILVLCILVLSCTCILVLSCTCILVLSSQLTDGLKTVNFKSLVHGSFESFHYKIYLINCFNRHF